MLQTKDPISSKGRRPSAQLDGLLFIALARTVERHLGEFKPQELANTAWAFAMVAQQDTQLVRVLARTAEWRLEDFNTQNLANTAWAFAMVA